MTKTLSSVLFIGLSTFSRIGGIQNFNRRLLKNITSLSLNGELGDCVAHLLGDEEGDLPEDQREALGFGSQRLRFVFRSLLSARNRDILLVGHINLIPLAFIAKLIRPSIRTILFVHGDEVWNDELRPRRFYEPMLLKYIDQIAAVSAYTARTMSRHYGPPLSRFSIFPNAIDNFTRAEYSRAAGNRILCVTRISRDDARKHVDQIIRAVAELTRKDVPLTLTIVGDGDIRKDLEDLARSLRIEQHVLFAGSVSSAELEEYYENADVFILPSSKEGFGIVFLEAWRHGLPVICGSQGAPPEIISDGVDGLVVDEADPVDIARKIERILVNSTEAAQMGSNGMNKVLSHYTNSSAIANLRDLLHLDARD